MLIQSDIDDLVTDTIKKFKQGKLTGNFLGYKPKTCSGFPNFWNSVATESSSSVISLVSEFFHVELDRAAELIRRER